MSNIQRKKMWSERKWPFGDGSNGVWPFYVVVLLVVGSFSMGKFDFYRGRKRRRKRRGRRRGRRRRRRRGVFCWRCGGASLRLAKQFPLSSRHFRGIGCFAADWNDAIRLIVFPSPLELDCLIHGYVIGFR